jgi:hypothetical protein
MRRNDLDDRPHFRSGDRVFCTNGQWFFMARERDVGPYDTREVAHAELLRFVKKMSALDLANSPAAPEAAKLAGRFSDYKPADLELVDKDDPPSTTP